MVFEKGSQQKNVHVETHVALDVDSNTLFDKGICSSVICAPFETDLIQDDCPVCYNTLPIAGSPVQCLNCHYICCFQCAHKMAEGQTCFHCRARGTMALVNNNLPTCQVQGITPLIKQFKTNATGAARFGILISAQLSDLHVHKIINPIFDEASEGLLSSNHQSVAIFGDSHLSTHASDVSNSNITHLICINTSEVTLCKFITNMPRVQRVLRIVTCTAVRDLSKDRYALRKLLPDIDLSTACDLADRVQVIGYGALTARKDGFLEGPRGPKNICQLSTSSVYNLPHYTLPTPYEDVVDLANE